MMEFVNGQDDIPDMKWKNKIHVPNHQPEYIYIYTIWLFNAAMENHHF